MSPRVLGALALADFRERVRRPAYAVVLLAAVGLGYLAAPAAGAHWTIVNAGAYRGVYNSAYIGTVTALAGALWLSAGGFYVIRTAVARDRQSGVGELLAATPIRAGGYLIGKFLSNLLVLGSMAVALAGTALALQLVRGESRAVDAIALLSPFVLCTLPVLAVTAAAAILFETTPVLRSGLGNVLWLFAAMAGAVAGQSANALLGGLGMNAFAESLRDEFASQGIALAEIALGLMYLDDPPRAVPWDGIDFTAGFAGQRLLLVVLAAVAALVPALWFDRFDPARSSGAIAGRPKTSAAARRQIFRTAAAGPSTSAGAMGLSPFAGAAGRPSHFGAAGRPSHFGAVGRLSDFGAAGQPSHFGAGQEPAHGSAAVQPPHHGVGGRPCHDRLAEPWLHADAHAHAHAHADVESATHFGADPAPAEMTLVGWPETGLDSAAISYPRPDNPALLTPRRGAGILRLLRGEIRILTGGVSRWWWLGTTTLMVTGVAAVPAGPDAARPLLMAAWIWPVLVWSRLGAQARENGAEGLLDACPSPVFRTLAQWLAGAALTTAVAIGPALAMAADGHLADWLAGAAFIPALAVALGVVSRTQRSFQAVYPLLWYLVINDVAGLDYLGVLAGGPSPLVVATAAALLLLAALTTVGVRHHRR